MKNLLDNYIYYYNKIFKNKCMGETYNMNKKNVLFCLLLFLIIIVLIIQGDFFYVNKILEIIKKVFKLLMFSRLINMIVVLIFIIIYFLLKKVEINLKLILKKIVITTSVINAFIIEFILGIKLILKYIKSGNDVLIQMEDKLQYVNTDTINIFLIVLISIFYCYQFLILKKICIDKLVNKKIEIVFGEINFEKISNREVLVIPANTSFDTIFDGVISENSLHGMAIKYLKNKNIDVEQEIKNKLQNKKVLGQENRRHNNARKEYYKYGECIEVQQIIFTAFTKLDSYDRAKSMNLSDYTIRMLKIFNNVEKIKNNRNIIIPFFGTGNINMCSQGITYQNLLENLVDIILKSELNFSKENKIKIILYNMTDEISLYELKNKFN